MNNPIVLGIGISKYKCDGVLRFEHFCKLYGLEYKIVGDGQIWRGGDMAAGPGGGQKINQLLDELEQMDNRLVIVCDTFDLYPVAGVDEIMHKFNLLHKPNSVIFAAEVYCWPDKSLASDYPVVEHKYKYLNSGSIMGYSDDIYKLINNANINDWDDDQLFFTNKFLSNNNETNNNETNNNEIKIILDYKCELFQALNGVTADVVLVPQKNRLYNKYTNTYPIFIHGNGPAKTRLNYFENYLSSMQNNLLINKLVSNKLVSGTEPKVFIALYIDSSNYDQMIIFLNHINFLKYNSNCVIHLYDRHCKDDTLVKQYLTNFSDSDSDSDSDSNSNSNSNSDIAYYPNVIGYHFDHFIKSDCEYYFLVEQSCIITNAYLLQNLIKLCDANHRIICPLMVNQNNQCFTNFWGALDRNEYYERSPDYLDLVNRVYCGLWNVPYVSGTILICRSIIMYTDLTANPENLDYDMVLCKNFRKNTMFMYMSNFENYGYLY